MADLIDAAIRGARLMAEEQRAAAAPMDTLTEQILSVAHKGLERAAKKLESARDESRARLVRSLVEDLAALLEPPGPMPEGEHVDDFIWRNHGGDPYARFVLALYRQPASLKLAIEPWVKQHPLYCTYAGKRYRCTGASRMGDVWLRADPSQDTGYDAGGRVPVAACSEWGPRWEGESAQPTGGVHG
jgi:hypothetical protein